MEPTARVIPMDQDSAQDSDFSHTLTPLHWSQEPLESLESLLNFSSCHRPLSLPSFPDFSSTNNYPLSSILLTILSSGFQPFSLFPAKSGTSPSVLPQSGSALTALLPHLLRMSLTSCNLDSAPNHLTKTVFSQPSSQTDHHLSDMTVSLIFILLG